ncbi:unnamed protein product [Somion occarium]
MHSDWSDESDELEAFIDRIVPLSSSPPSSSPGRTVTPPTIGSDGQTQIRTPHTPTEDEIYAPLRPTDASFGSSIGVSDNSEPCQNVLDESSPTALKSSSCARRDSESINYYSDAETTTEDSEDNENYPLDRPTLNTPRSQAAFSDHLNMLLTRVALERSIASPVSPLSSKDSVANVTCNSPVSPEVSYTSRRSVSSSGYDASQSCSMSTASCSSPARLNFSPAVHPFCDLSGESKENGTPGRSNSESGALNNIKALPLYTPNNAENGSAVPAAPKKTQRHIRIPALSAAYSTSARVASNDPSASVKPRNILVFKDLYKRSNDDSSAYTQYPAIPNEASLDMEAPPAKKRKVLASRSLPAIDDPRKDEKREVAAPLLAADRFASRRASLRKAASLVSESSQLDAALDKTPVPRFKVKIEPLSAASTVSHLSLTHTACLEPVVLFSDDCTKTEPVTPMPRKSASAKSRKQRKKGTSTPLPHPLPIIAPPPFVNIPRAPASLEEFAEGRLVTMLSKEREERFDDGLPSTRISRREENNVLELEHQTSDYAKTSDEEMDDDEKQLWKEYPHPDDEVMRECSAHDSARSKVEDCECEEELTLFTCIDEEFRQEIIEWMLDALPPVFPAKPDLCRQLHMELSQCIDTRWHAAQMFTRYFIHLGASPPSTPTSSQRSLFDHSRMISANDEGAAMIWDIATACIALSVKFHRDVLQPLVPVFTDEFILMAPHRLTYEELESAQRDVLSVLDFCIGSVTPGAFIEELWNALPSLRRLLETKSLWETAKALAWEMISDALFDIDYIRYSTSTLTACALVQGISEALIIERKGRPQSSRSQRMTKMRRDARCHCAKIGKSVSKIVKGVEMDLREVVGVDEKNWNACKSWLLALDT